MVDLEGVADTDEEVHQVEVVVTEVVHHLEEDIAEQAQDTAMKIVHLEMELLQVDMLHARIVHHTLNVQIVTHVHARANHMHLVHVAKINFFSTVLCQEISCVKRLK